MKREILSILVMFAVFFVVAGNVNAGSGPQDGVSHGPEYYGGEEHPPAPGDDCTCERACVRDCDPLEDCEPQKLRDRVRAGVDVE